MSECQTAVVVLFSIVIMLLLCYYCLITVLLPPLFENPQIIQSETGTQPSEIDFNSVLIERFDSSVIMLLSFYYSVKSLPT